MHRSITLLTKEYKNKFKDTIFFGIPITELKGDHLRAAICFMEKEVNYYKKLSEEKKLERSSEGLAEKVKPDPVHPEPLHKVFSKDYFEVLSFIETGEIPESWKKKTLRQRLNGWFR